MEVQSFPSTSVGSVHFQLNLKIKLRNCPCKLFFAPKLGSVSSAHKGTLYVIFSFRKPLRKAACKFYA